MTLGISRPSFAAKKSSSVARLGAMKKLESCESGELERLVRARGVSQTHRSQRHDIFGESVEFYLCRKAPFPLVLGTERLKD